MDNESTIRLAIFLGLFAALALAEWAWPQRHRVESQPRRWLTNWAMSLLNTGLLRLLAFILPALAVGAAVDAQSLGIGLFNWLDWPLWLEGLVAVLALDFAIWLQHLITHKVPLLWRLHRVHHADRDLDVTTAIRFHPVEIGLSMLLKIGLVYALGPHFVAVIVFEILLNGTALFTHANLRLPKRVDAALRLVLVTPDMHLIHHSTKRAEHDSNYGFALSVWDRIFTTYRAHPAPDFTTGLQWQDARPAKLGFSLLLPFLRK
ncbi:sterol desaturase family protein [Abyssibius alkaniclasticus]|uniref:sterol desaturase family protein n=1 Tax=Abyssibius alkaniclasticus TaxID=2881234 RepID=UPI00405A191A